MFPGKTRKKHFYNNLAANKVYKIDVIVNITRKNVYNCGVYTIHMYRGTNFY